MVLIFLVGHHLFAVMRGPNGLREALGGLRQPPMNSGGVAKSPARFVSPCMIEKTPNSVVTCQTHRTDLIQEQNEQTLLCFLLHLLQQADEPLKMDLGVHPMLAE